jgi:TetR/AcrR family transcriptional repressor of nem operon
MKMKKLDDTRQFILERSAPIFNAKGLAGTAMRDILEATEMAKGGVYRHFENKEQLSYFAVDYCLNSLAEKTSDVMDGHQTAKNMLFAYLDFLSDPVGFPVTGGCPVLNFGVEADDTDPIVRKKVNKFIERNLQNFTAIIEHGISNGEFRKSWNAKEFALKMFALAEGGILVSRVAGNNLQMKTIVKIIKKEIEDQSL